MADCGTVGKYEKSNVVDVYRQGTEYVCNVGGDADVDAEVKSNMTSRSSSSSSISERSIGKCMGWDVNGKWTKVRIVMMMVIGSTTGKVMFCEGKFSLFLGLLGWIHACFVDSSRTSGVA